MYCDDTSGNLSKKWNEHNSFLFLPAGLPRAQAQKEFNIHFLSTSNIAPPLEMLDGIVEQLECVFLLCYRVYYSSSTSRTCKKEGIWAWDCIKNEAVLVIPMVLALLGDNPMQSEFACHIGLRGKLFCRACWVKGTDAQSEPAQGSSRPNNDGSDTDVQSDSGSVAGSEGGPSVEMQEGSDQVPSVSGSKTKRRRKKALESMSSMVTRVKDFIKVFYD
jgi:hypothetical protein